MSGFREKYTPVFYKLVANIMLWVIFMVVFLGLYIFKHNLSPSENIPANEVYGLINWTTFWVLVISSFILFTIFSFATHKSDKTDEVERGKKFMDIALAECSGVLFNFGSLVAAVTIFTNNWLYLFVTAITYFIGVFLHPKK
ncbi:hypothetical protein [Shewanella kaireitica]|uniref:hypothetical protein n=1 Tax=Shewanella kaireitica TaxID=212021 RepID=UPI00200D71CA|nr:hypothetical protein [Shewanella kaireitica]MCL1096228.1 hypothetical protein [Shewanella kaireitica]